MKPAYPHLHRAPHVADPHTTRIAKVTIVGDPRGIEIREIPITSWNSLPLLAVTGAHRRSRQSPNWSKLLPGYRVESVLDNEGYDFVATLLRAHSAPMTKTPDRIH